MSDTETSQKERQAPLSVWRAVRGFVCTLFDLFGAPEQLAARHTLTLAQHTLILPWLRAGEALLRRLLLIEAALIASESSNGPRTSTSASLENKSGPGGPRSGMPAVRPRKPVEHDPDRPEHWRVSFRVFASYRRLPGGSKKCRQDADGTKFRSAWPLAERFEALLRVYNNPAPYARRLAQRLRKVATLAQRIASSAWGQCRDLIGHTLHDVLTEPIRNAARVFAELAPNTS